MTTVITLNDYYKFEKQPNQKSKTRLDCIASTQSYNDFEMLRNKADELFVYYGNVPDNFGGNVRRKADKAITKVKNISSIFIPDLELRNFAFGDIKGTKDAILMIINDNETMIEIFIARGYKSHVKNLWQCFVGGDYDNDISELRAAAVTELVTKNSELENGLFAAIPKTE
jgi:hypothetical protein